MEIKKIELDSIKEVMNIIQDAKELLSRDSLQWQQGYPNLEVMKQDILSNSLYGAFINNILVGICAYVIGIEPNYVVIDGKWDNPPSETDLTIHRIAVKKEYHNKKIGDALVKYSFIYGKEHNCTSVKIDTHKLNIPMQKLCERNGLKYKGIITLLRDEVDNTRLAYEKSI